jgi:flagellar protein FlaJ
MAKSSTAGIYLWLYRFPFTKYLADSIRPKLLKAGISEDPQYYAARLMFYILMSLIPSIIFILLGILIIIKLYFVTLDSRYIIASLMMFVFSIIIPFITYYALVIVSLANKTDQLKTGLDSETPAFSAVFVVFLKSGLTPKSLFESLSKVTALRYISQMSRFIVKRMKYLSEGLEESLEAAIKVSPSKVFNEYISTYLTAIRTGAPVLETMISKTKDVLKTLEIMASSAADKLSGVAEIYVVWLASGYITLFLAVLLFSIFPSITGGLSLPMVGVLLVIVVPIMNLIFVLMADSAQLKFPERKMTAYKVFWISFGIGLGLIFGLLIINNEIIQFLTLSGTLKDIPITVLIFTIGLLVASIPPSIVAIREIRKGTGYDPYVVRVLRAIAEGLRAGLSPETIIKNIKNSKELGKMRKILVEVDAYLNLGLTLKDALKRAAEKIDEFSSKVALISLADMIEVGSMTPETVEILAEQIESQIRIRREYNAKVRILLYMPYVGILLAIIATILLANSILQLLTGEGSQLYSSYGPLATASLLLPAATYIVAVSALWNSFLAGFLVGKLSHGKVAMGFIHSSILVVITAILIIISLQFSLVPKISPSTYSL